MGDKKLVQEVIENCDFIRLRKEGEGENNNLFTVGDVDYVFCCDGYRDNNINIGLEAIKMELLLSASFGALAITGGVLTVVMAIDLLNQFRNR